MRVFLMVLLLAATVARAEYNCGRAERFATNFSATVQSVEPIGQRELAITAIDEPDLRHAVTVNVAGLKEDNLALRNGATIVFGVHSPAKSFGDAEAAGKTHEMQAVWLACDGKFRKFEELVPAASRVVEVYDGWIEVGHVYRAKVAGQALEPHPALPHHHDGGYGWMNADGLLPDDDQERTVVFVVASQEIERVAEWTWMNLVDLVIREVR
jgi:hypothetical protein